MRGEERYQKRSDGRSGRGYGDNGISKGRSTAVIVLILALFLYQVTLFVVEKSSKNGGAPGTYNSGDSAAVAFLPGQMENHPVKGAKAVKGAKGGADEMALFSFDPNTVGADSLVLLGLSPRQAESILKYRAKGGKFRRKEDFSKMYVVSEELYARLEPYIEIADSSPYADIKMKKRREKKMEKEWKNVKEDAKEKVEENQGYQREQRIPLMVELNSADTSQLVKLYGIGPYYAEKIIEYRERLGNFYTPRQLMEVEGIDSARFALFARNVKADASAIRQFSLDTAGKRFLISHPYIGAYRARGIMLMREKFGAAACSLENLVKERVIAKDIAEKLWYYIVE